VRERVALALLLVSSTAFADVPRGTYHLTKPEEPTAAELNGRALPPCEREVADRVGERRQVIVEFTPNVQPGATIQVNGEDWVFDSEDGRFPGALHAVRGLRAASQPAAWRPAPGMVGDP